MRHLFAMIVPMLIGCAKPEAETAFAPKKIAQKPSEQQPSNERLELDHVQAKAAAKAQAREINEALIRDDFSAVVERSLPSVVKFNGGAEKMILTMKRGSEEMKVAGTAIQTSSIGEPGELVTQGKEQFVVVPFEMEMKVPNGRLRALSFVIGVSSDRGETWKFVNGDLEPHIVKLAIPNLPNELQIPSRSQPTFERD